jgi:hypothetical protein
MARGKNMTKRHHRTEARAIQARKERERRRTRCLRAEIHAAMEKARRMTIYPQSVAGPWRAPDLNVEGGWVVESLTVDFVTYASSRDKARALAREANSGEIEICRRQAADRDEAMNLLGWRRIGTDGPVEERFARVSA